MSDSQEKKVLTNLKKNIQESVYRKGISMAKLVRDIDMSEPGFYKMLETGSMKVKTLVKISEVLDQPLITLFEGDTSINQIISGNNNTLGVNSNISGNVAGFSEGKENYREKISDMAKLIQSLERQIEDKEKIIQLLERR